MTATPIQSDLAMYSAIRTRRRRQEYMRGWDARVARYQTKLKHARSALPYLKRESEAVLKMEKQWAELGEKALDEKVLEVREVFARRQYKDEHVRLAMAAAREIAWRQIGERPYMVQVMGALGLFNGQIVEMVTGEGKTLTAAIAATVLGWTRRPTHVITVNDYLAERDAESRNKIYHRAGLHASAVVGEMQPHDRLAAYRQPIVYTTQKEIVADWLRDQLRLGRIADPVSTRWKLSGVGSQASIMVPGLHVAIVDEIDAILIDEAVTPLIIAQPREEDPQADLYIRARDLAKELEPKKHFKIDLAKRQCKLNDRGRDKIGELLTDEEHGIWRAIRRREELVEQALVAEYCYHFGQHYHIQEDKVVIVDEFTGRFMPDRQWQNGLHQAAEAKHDLPITADRDTLASLSFQRYFQQYEHLCGMTGTAADAKVEMETTYKLPVRIIPTNKPIQRVQLPDWIFVTEQLKWQAVADEIDEMHKLGRPVLVGTRSIEASEYLDRLLTDRGLEHQVLNAVHHKDEAEIVSNAGQRGAITVATNMAGRGTDIKLGKGVDDLGGLHVILTERHAARRIDRQLFGRSGRQGDPGSAREINSLEDELVLKHAGRVSAGLRTRFAGRTTPLPKWVRFVFNLAQRRAQNKAFHARASVLRHEEDLDRSLPR